MSRLLHQGWAIDHSLRQIAVWSAACALAVSVCGIALGQETDYKDPNVQKSFPAQPGSEEANAAAAASAPSQAPVSDPNGRPETADPGRRGRIGFGAFGVVSAATTDSVLLQGPVPGVPISRIPLRPDIPVYRMSPVALAELREPAMGVVIGNLPADAITMSPAIITFESSSRTASAPPPVSGPGHFAGMVTIREGKPYLRVNQKDVLLATADNTPVYRASPASRADIRKGANLYIGRKYNPDATWGDYNAVYILPDGPLPAIQFDAVNANNPPVPAPAPAQAPSESHGGG